ncbi:MAG TPA: threonine synthase [Candidatus Marinimicrobia bacterium]|nr:threonine synthase [Candidatus Neomarinimicrobiota bacterium]
MRFYSTKGNSPYVGFKDALFKGLAPDGGLYMPESIFVLENDFFRSDLSFPDLAVEMIHPFSNEDLPKNELKDICKAAFDFPVPIMKLNDHNSVLELFHGPTLAFKDFAARFMARTMAYFLEHNIQELTILVATSGDTGSAVANGFFGVEGIKVIILYPSTKVSAIQEKQLTTLGGNITALEIEGTFDDCQRMVKDAFRDDDLRKRRFLSSANSINIARLLPQSVYYAWAWKQCGENEPVIFSVPSGNFGNLTGGLLAKKMGVPVEKFIAATNSNDVFPKYLNNGIVSEQDAVQTISNAMDVGVPSNLERIQNLFHNDINQVKADISSWCFSDETTRHAIQTTKKKSSYLVDPHTAVGILGLEKYRKETQSISKGIILSTAHPGKFAEAIEPIIGEKTALPKSLQLALKKKKVAIQMSNQFLDFKEFLLAA